MASPAITDRKQATCQPAGCTALIAAPPDENSAAAASTLRRAATGVGLRGAGAGMWRDLNTLPSLPSTPA